MTYRYWVAGAMRDAHGAVPVSERQIAGATDAQLYTRETLSEGRMAYVVTEGRAGMDVSLPKMTRGMAVTDARTRLQGQSIDALVGAALIARGKP